MIHAHPQPATVLSIHHSPVPMPDATHLLDGRALNFLQRLHTRFEAARQQLLADRQHRNGELPQFDTNTRTLRTGVWRAAPVPEILQDRRVEITGPVEAKTVINALNSDANVFMADFEDSTAPTWRNILGGQQVLHAAVRGRLTFSATPDTAPTHTLQPDPRAVLMVRPRGLHLSEKHVTIDGVAMSGLLFDLGVFAFHNAELLSAKQRGPFFYIPKLQSYAEAQWLELVLQFIENELALAPGQIKVTVLIETLPAAFQMDEIIHALRTRIVALNCGRWDYIFSAIKTLHMQPDFMLPERNQITMRSRFLNSYATRLIQTCHRRGILAMGGMAAQIPMRHDAAANSAALTKVRADKQREADLGHDGTWVAHPGLIATVRAIFDAALLGPNQLHVMPSARIEAEDLRAPCAGSITPEGFNNTVEVCVRYLAAWLSGTGCLTIHGLMEDAATAEICRSLLWLWLHKKDLCLSDGTPLSWTQFDAVLLALPNRLRQEPILGHEQLDAAIALLEALVRAPVLTDFLTIPAYAHL